MNLEREVICDFEVTEQRKKVWQTELEILKAFIAVCNQYGFQYFGADGTLIGCVRHKGFIPWDDDIDVYMKREQYEKFLQVAPDVLPPYYVLCVDTGNAQIQDIRTAALHKTGFDRLSSGASCGIFVDVFPLDYVADKPKSRKKEARKIWFYNFCCRKNKSNHTFKQRIYSTFAFVYNRFHSPEQTAEKARNPWPHRKTNTLGIATFAPGHENWTWPVHYFDETIEMPFEDIMLCVPKEFDAILRKEYGDYMTIPENKDGSFHTCYFDTEKAYTSYAGISEEAYRKLFENA